MPQPLHGAGDCVAIARGGGGLAPRPFKDQIIGNKRVTLNIGDYGSESSDVG